MSFCRDLWLGVIGNARNCMTTPLTRKKIFIMGGIMLVIILFIIIICVSSSATPQPDPPGREALGNAPFIWGNLDVKEVITPNFNLSNYDYSRFSKDFGVQVLTTSVDCAAQFKDAVSQTIDQLDFISRLVEGSGIMKMVLSSGEVRKLKGGSYSGAMMAVGGGHSIDGRLSLLRNYFALGVRVMNLAAVDCSNPWATSVSGFDSSITSTGSDFIKAVVMEMNRLGMAIDLAGSNRTIQTFVLENSAAPVLYRAVAFYSLVNNSVNIDDVILQKLKEKHGMIMLSLDCNLFAKADNCTKKDFKELLHEAKSKMGASLIGIGGLVDSKGKLPSDLGYRDFPGLFDELKNEGWTMAELEGLAGNNFLNFIQKVEEEAHKEENVKAIEKYLDMSKLPPEQKVCYTPELTPGTTTTQVPSTTSESTQTPPSTTSESTQLPPSTNNTTSPK